MARKGNRVFRLADCEVEEYLMAETSDTEDALILDDEDQSFLLEDMQAGFSEAIIEPPGPSSSNQNPDLSSDSLSTIPIFSSSSNPVPEFKWKKNIYCPYVFSDTDYEFGKINISQELQSLKPLGIFEAVTNINLLIEELIIPQSLRYAHQNGSVFTTDLQEMRAFLGMNYVMGYHVLPTLRSYWSTESDMGVPYIAKVMPLSRFEEIRRNLHFCDNASQPSLTSPTFDRAYKIRQVMNHFNSSFQSAMNNTKTQAIDEHMVKFKGHNIMRQYMQNKPIKRGFKMWCRADSSTGYLFQFDLYTGKKNSGPEIGLGESVVLDLTQALVGLGCEIYFDNFFNSPMLQYKLAKENLRACGTVRTQRKNNPKKLPLDKDMKRGDIYATSFEGISFIKWMDNKAVHLLTNFLSPVPTQKVKRRQVGSAQCLEITCPDVVHKYNKNMGGVDLMDQKKVTYEVDRKSKIKYYLRLFFDLLDIAMNNSYIVYEKLHSQHRIEGHLLSSLEYRQVVARGMIGDFSIRKHALPSTFMTKKRIQNIGHKQSLPSHVLIKGSSRKRCVQCAKSGVENRTNNICEFCNVNLCFTATRNCFAEFH